MQIHLHITSAQSYYTVCRWGAQCIYYAPLLAPTCRKKKKKKNKKRKEKRK